MSEARKGRIVGCMLLGASLAISGAVIQWGPAAGITVFGVLLFTICFRDLEQFE